MVDRDFKGIFIPREIWLDNRLTVVDKFILMELRSMDMKPDKSCVEYLAGFCGCSKKAVMKSMAKLVELGYIIKADK